MIHVIVEEQAVSLVRGPTEIIAQDLTADAAVFAKRSGIPALVFYRGSAGNSLRDALHAYK